MLVWEIRSVVSFDAVVEDYASGRPDYPDAVYDALVPLDSGLVVEGGCGTGLATRALVARGARLVALDIGPRMVQHTVAHAPALFGAAVADGAAMPFREASVDLLCFAQSWHWLDERRRIAEAARVLAPGGRWAAWWSHARVDDEPWFQRYLDLVEGVTPAFVRTHRDIDWGRPVHDSGLFARPERISVPWQRRVSIDHWIAEERSKSYVSALPATARQRLLVDIEALLRDANPSGALQVPYETWLWIARKQGR